MRLARLVGTGSLVCGLLLSAPACTTLHRTGSAAGEATGAGRDIGADRPDRSGRSRGGPDSVPLMAAQPQPSTPDGITFPVTGPNQWYQATARAAPAGRSGTLLRYRVLVERGIEGVDVNDFATQVSAILGDPRGWTGTGAWRLRLAGTDQPYDFTILLATPGSRDRLCADGVDGYTSCRRGDDVVLNVARWAQGVPGYGAPLERYREYMVNHEVGHRLGHGHQLCPGRGRPAPVMQQQTLGLHGCLANPWPIRDGRFHTGPSGQYDDHPPAVR